MASEVQATNHIHISRDEATVLEGKTKRDEHKLPIWLEYQQSTQNNYGAVVGCSDIGNYLNGSKSV